MMPKLEEELKAEGCNFNRDEFMAMINDNRHGKLINVQNGKNKVGILIKRQSVFFPLLLFALLRRKY
ncbi:MAG: hypothetical protein HZA48_05720 [Planctomycetes bacterium]|nr:hypothetical protein [Planctomycetota bacterium]